MNELFQAPPRVKYIPLEQIDPSPFQPRREFAPDELAGLAASIKQNGLLVPVSLRPGAQKGRYQLVAGERRLRACRLAGMKKIPALITRYDDDESAALGLLENMQRQGLNPFEQARGIKEVLERWNCTQARAAERLGISQPALANKLRLLALTPAQQAICLQNALGERHARAVLRLPEGESRTQALEVMAKRALSARQADEYVTGLLSAPPRPPRRIIPVIRDVKIFFNTVDKAVKLMNQAGVPAQATRRQEGDYIEYLVRIPAAAAQKPAAAPQAPAQTAAPAGA
ncbi:MAG: ParB/RepB/Spo0J family partition protein [Oscillospiraceae bacterium]|nr:ParB/RepB/Spo0J family partition protein [Oscillospiraceae bacterium]